MGINPTETVPFLIIDSSEELGLPPRRRTPFLRIINRQALCQITSSLEGTYKNGELEHYKLCRPRVSEDCDEGSLPTYRQVPK